MSKKEEKKRKKLSSSSSQGGMFDPVNFVEGFKASLKDPEIRRLLGNLMKDSVLKELRRKNEELESEVTDLRQRMEDMEQYSMRTSVKIAGIPEMVKKKDEEGESNQVYEDTDKLILELAADMKVEIKPDDIGRSHRVARINKQPGVPRDIVCRFVAYNAKRRFKSGKKELKNIPGRENVYINDHLTAQRSNVFFHARKLKKANRIKDCWCTDGRIYLKSNKDKIKVVTSLDQLNELFPSFSGLVDWRKVKTGPGKVKKKKTLSFEEAMAVVGTGESSEASGSDSEEETDF